MRYLVVANQTLIGRHVLEEVEARIQAGPSSFHILVPATPPHLHFTWTEGEARALAKERLDQALFELRDLGADVTGEVGAERALDAITDACRRAAAKDPFDEIILSTLPPGASRWIRQGLPERAAHATGLPVRHLITDTADVF